MAILLSNSEFVYKKYENFQEKIWESAKQILLEMVIGRNLNFDDCVSLLCKKARKKTVLSMRLSKFTGVKKRESFMKTFFDKIKSTFEKSS